MKKKLAASIVATIVLSVGVFAFIWFSQDAVQAQQNPSNPVSAEEELAELRALIQALTGMIAEGSTAQSAQNVGAQVGIPQMSGQAAMNIAVEHLGSGTAQGVELLEIDNTLIFVVNVANGTLLYDVHVNAMTGDIMNFNTDGGVLQSTPQPPVITTATPQAVSTPAPAAPPQSSSTSAPRSSSSPSGR